jgi:hypothetical protein
LRAFRSEEADQISLFNLDDEAGEEVVLAAPEDLPGDAEPVAQNIAQIEGGALALGAAQVQVAAPLTENVGAGDVEQPQSQLGQPSTSQ